MAAILHPADPDWWGHHRHGRHAGGHRPCLPPPHVSHHRGSRQRRLQRHADAGWWWWDSEITQGRACPPWHRPVRALQELQTRMHILGASLGRAETPHFSTSVGVVKLASRTCLGQANSQLEHVKLDSLEKDVCPELWMRSHANYVAKLSLEPGLVYII